MDMTCLVRRPERDDLQTKWRVKMFGNLVVRHTLRPARLVTWRTDEKNWCIRVGLYTRNASIATQTMELSLTHMQIRNCISLKRCLWCLHGVHRDLTQNLSHRRTGGHLQGWWMLRILWHQTSRQSPNSRSKQNIVLMGYTFTSLSDNIVCTDLYHEIRRRRLCACVRACVVGRRSLIIHFICLRNKCP